MFFCATYGQFSTGSACAQKGWSFAETGSSKHDMILPNLQVRRAKYGKAGEAE